MSVQDVLDRYGDRAVCGFVALVLVFLALRALRAPFDAVSRGLSAAMAGVDRTATARVSTSDTDGSRAGAQQSRHEPGVFTTDENTTNERTA